MAIRLRGQPEDYMTARMAELFRERARVYGVPPVMYIDDSGRYQGDEDGLAITSAGVAQYMCHGLRALSARDGKVATLWTDSLSARDGKGVR